MITPQSIREKTFEKAVFGGYDMSSVDDYLENVASDFAALQKDVAVLKGKMKVLVEKIEDYRATEDAMRMALLSAQKMANQIVAEAKENSESTLNTAKAEAESLLRDARAEVIGEETKLLEAKRSSVKYMENMRMLSMKHLDFLDALSDKKAGGSVVTTPPPAEKKAIAEVMPSSPVISEPELDDTVRTIGDRVAHLADDESPDLDVHPEIDGIEPESDNREPTRLYRYNTGIQ